MSVFCFFDDILFTGTQDRNLAIFDITQKLSAPYHPATNGQAERMVQPIKTSNKSMENDTGGLLDNLITILMHLIPNAAGPSQIKTKEMLCYILMKKPSTRKQKRSVMYRSEHLRRVQVLGYRNRRIGHVTRTYGKLHYNVPCVSEAH